MKNKKTIAFVLVIVAVLLGAAFYFLYWLRTPAYALNQVRLAVKEHNTAKFERYVDLDSLMSNAFEDIIKSESKINNDNLFSNPFALSILHLLKPSVVDLMKKEALDRIATIPSTPKAEQVVDLMATCLRHVDSVDALSVRTCLLHVASVDVLFGLVISIFVYPFQHAEGMSLRVTVNNLFLYTRIIVLIHGIQTANIADICQI